MGSAPSVQLPVLKARGEIHSTVPRGGQEEEMMLERVCYMTHPNSQTGWIVDAERLDHHLLLLYFRRRHKQNNNIEGSSVGFILAEKVAAPPDQAGIRILWYLSLDSLLRANSLADTPLTLCKQIQGCLPRALSLRHVEAILQDYNPSFHVLSSNCQHYAQHVWSRLLCELEL